MARRGTRGSQGKSRRRSRKSVGVFTKDSSSAYPVIRLKNTGSAFKINMAGGAKNYPSGWEMEFAPYAWFFISGFREIVDTYKIDLRNITLDSYRRRSNEFVSQEDVETFYRNQWDRNLSFSQLLRARQNRPVTLDRAVMLIATLNQYIERSSSSMLDNLLITPAFYTIADLAKPLKVVLDDWSGSFAISFRRSVGQNSKKFLYELGQGYGTTYKTLYVIAKFFAERNISGCSPADIRPIEARSWKARSDIPHIDVSGLQKRPAQGGYIFR